MHDFVIEREHINAEALDHNLRDTFGSAIYGLSFSKGKVAVHFVDSPTPEQKEQAETLVQSHDANALSPTQQAAQDRESGAAQAKPAALAAVTAAQTAHADVKDNWTALAAGAKLEALRQLTLSLYAIVRWLVIRELT